MKNTCKTISTTLFLYVQTTIKHFFVYLKQVNLVKFGETWSSLVKPGPWPSLVKPGVSLVKPGETWRKPGVDLVKPGETWCVTFIKHF